MISGKKTVGCEEWQFARSVGSLWKVRSPAASLAVLSASWILRFRNTVVDRFWKNSIRSGKAAAASTTKTKSEIKNLTAWVSEWESLLVDESTQPEKKKEILCSTSAKQRRRVRARGIFLWKSSDFFSLEDFWPVWCVFGANLPRQGRKDRNIPIGTRLAIGISVWAKKPAKDLLPEDCSICLGCGEGNSKVLLLRRRRRHFFSAFKDGIGANSVRLKLIENQGKKRTRMLCYRWNGSFHIVRLSKCNWKKQSI